MLKTEISVSASLRISNEILEAREGKIRDFEKEDLQRLGVALTALVAQCATQNGCRKKIEARELADYANFIIRNYSFFSLKDVKLAFELVATDKLQLDANLYGSFDRIILGKILNSYRKYQNEIVTKYEKLELAEREEIEKSNLAEVNNQNLRTNFLEIIETAKSKIDFWEDAPEIYYTIAEEKEILVISDDEKWDNWYLALTFANRDIRKKYCGSKGNYGSRKKYESGYYSEEIKSLAKTYARKITVFTHLLNKKFSSTRLKSPKKECPQIISKRNFTKTLKGYYKKVEKINFENISNEK